MWRPLRFASLDPEVAAARGVPVRLLSPIFMLVLGLAVADRCRSSARCSC